jgi:hypothetical protein
MFSQSQDLSQSSNGDYNFLHSSQNSSQFEFDGIQNKNQNIFGVGELGTINEENPISPLKINFNDESKKSLANNTNISKTSKYSFTNNNNIAQRINIRPSISENIEPNLKKSKIQIKDSSSNKENINTINNNNINNSKIELNPNLNSNVNITLGEVSQGGENNFFNFDNYKCHLSQQIDQVEKIALQSMNASENSKNNNFNNNGSNDGFINNISEEELLEHQKFNQYCSDLIDQAMKKNIEYIDNIKNEFVNNMDTYKMKFRTNAEVIKKLILLYSDDVFQKEKNKMIISHLADQLLSHINSFFQEMSKFNNFNLNFNSSMANKDINSTQNP